jgi:hypothetical protein
MPDNGTINNYLQMGMESTFGVQVPATKRAQSFGLDIDLQVNTDSYAPGGYLFPTDTGIIQEWVEASLSGILTYTEVVYPLSMMLGAATITTPAGGTTSRKWVYAPSANGIITPLSATFEKGSSVYAVKFGGGVVTGLNFGWTRKDKLEIGGSVLGKAVTAGASMTTIASNATVPLVRALPPQVDVYVDTTFAGLGTTKQLRAFEAGISFDNMFGAVWPLNSANTGHDGVIPTMPDTKSNMLLQADTAGMAFLANVRANTTVYVRIKATGPIIESAIPYLFQVDFAARVSDVDAFSDSDGIYGIPWSFQPIYDGVNPPITITIQNTQIAL